MRLECTHLFHKGCLERCQSNRCPICRRHYRLRGLQIVTPMQPPARVAPSSTPKRDTKRDTKRVINTTPASTWAKLELGIRRGHKRRRLSCLPREGDFVPVQIAPSCGRGGADVVVVRCPYCSRPRDRFKNGNCFASHKSLCKRRHGNGGLAQYRDTAPTLTKLTRSHPVVVCEESSAEEVDAVAEEVGCVPEEVGGLTEGTGRVIDLAAWRSTEYSGGYCGVQRLRGGRFRASINYEAESHIIGTFPTAEDAARAYAAKHLDLLPVTQAHTASCKTDSRPKQQKVRLLSSRREKPTKERLIDLSQWASDNSSGYVGVYPVANGMFKAQTYRNGSTCKLGVYSTAEEAAVAAANKYLDTHESPPPLKSRFRTPKAHVPLSWAQNAQQATEHYVEGTAAEIGNAGCSKVLCDAGIESNSNSKELQNVDPDSSLLFGNEGFCKHKRQRNRCRECGGSGICVHGRRRTTCTDCGGGGVCQHKRIRSQCKDCGGSAICEHQRQRSQCKECGGSSICKHKKRRSQCRDCGGSGICEHGRQHSRCKECGGSGICEHRRVRRQCKDCKGSAICQHGQQRSQSQKCGGEAIPLYTNTLLSSTEDHSASPSMTMSRDCRNDQAIQVHVAPATHFGVASIAPDDHVNQAPDFSTYFSDKARRITVWNQTTKRKVDSPRSNYI